MVGGGAKWNKVVIDRFWCLELWVKLANSCRGAAKKKFNRAGSWLGDYESLGTFITHSSHIHGPDTCPILPFPASERTNEKKIRRALSLFSFQPILPFCHPAKFPSCALFSVQIPHTFPSNPAFAPSTFQLPSLINAFHLPRLRASPPAPPLPSPHHSPPRATHTTAFVTRDYPTLAISHILSTHPELFRHHGVPITHSPSFLT
jgi:hypothetical protein